MKKHKTITPLCPNEVLTELGLHKAGTKPNTRKLTAIVKAGLLSVTKLSDKTFRYDKNEVEDLKRMIYTGQITLPKLT